MTISLALPHLRPFLLTCSFSSFCLLYPERTSPDMFSTFRNCFEIDPSSSRIMPAGSPRLRPSLAGEIYSLGSPTCFW